MHRLHVFSRVILATAAFFIGWPPNALAASRKAEPWYKTYDDFATPDSLKLPPTSIATPATNDTISAEDPPSVVRQDTADKPGFLLDEPKAKPGTITPFFKGGLSAQPQVDPHLAVGRQDPLDPDASMSPSLNDVDGGHSDRRLDGHIETGVQYHF